MDTETIKKYEQMAKLDLAETERAALAKEATVLEESFRKLSDIDTGGVRPLLSVLDIHNVLREDVAVKEFSREKILENAPEQYDGYFEVPKTLE